MLSLGATLDLHRGSARAACCCTLVVLPALNGRTVVVHGASGAGKTTLTTALVQAGLAYVTDETVCLDPDTLVIEPFTKPLTVKPGSQELLAHLAPPPEEVSEGSGNWQLPPERLGGPPLPDAELRPAVIVFPDVDPDRTDVVATPVSPARAAFVLGEQSSAMWAIEPRPLAAIARLVTTVPAFQVSYGNAFEAAPVIIGELMDAAPPRGSSHPRTPPSRHPPAPPARVARTASTGSCSRARPCSSTASTCTTSTAPAPRSGSPSTAGSTCQALPPSSPSTSARTPTHILLDVEDLVRVLSARKLISHP